MKAVFPGIERLQRCGLGPLLLLGAGVVQAQVSPYIPLQDRELNAQIEGLAVVANLPAMRKPFVVTEVRACLERVRERLPELYAELDAALRGHEQGLALTAAEATVATSHGAKDAGPMPNAFGERPESGFRVAAQGHWRLGDGLLVSAGGRVADVPSGAVPVGSFVALGGKYLQLDLGWRERWLSPFQDSAMVLSTEARPSLSAGLSNPQAVRELWNLHYEVFLSRLERVAHVYDAGRLQPGRPWLMGTHFSVEPLAGWTLGFTRTLQFGGGATEVTPRSIWDAFWNPVKSDNKGSFGNQEASFTSKLNVPWRTPFSLYVEYAAEDTASLSNSRLGNLALSFGVFVPFLPDWLLGKRWAFTYEFSEWQDGWYVHGKYRDGYTNDGVVMGHWGGSLRVPQDGVGATAHTARLQWRPGRGLFWEATYRRIENEDYGRVDYGTGRSLDLRVTGPLGAHRWGGRLLGGQDVFRNRYLRGELSWIW